MKNSIVAACVLFFLATTQVAAESSEVDPQTAEKIRNSLRVLLPGLRPDSIRSTPVNDFYEITFGTRLVYVTGDGRFLLQGKIIDLETRVEITDDRLAELKRAALDNVSEKEMIIYGPEDAKHKVTVFTDIDCGFCRRLHSEMDQYTEQGIEIRYLFYPRAGLGSESYDKAVSVWCADDQKAAMDAAKAGKTIESKTCENPVAEHFKLGQSLRIQGTPALVLEDGEVLPGYVPADKLRKVLDQRAAKSGD